MTIVEGLDKLKEFADGFEPMILGILHDNEGTVGNYITEQLYSGLNGNDKPLRPTYLNDLFFKSEEAGSWKNNARGYMMWKKKITPPYASSWIGAPRRSDDTPNLIIIGLFYDSISAASSSEGLIISSNASFSGDIEQKYGSAIFKVGTYARRHFFKEYVEKGLESYFRKFGV